MGLTRQLWQEKAVAADPSRNGVLVLDTPFGTRSKKSRNNKWRGHRLRRSVHLPMECHKYRHTGNQDCTTLFGFDMIVLITFIMAYQDTIIGKMAIFIYNKEGDLF